MSTARFVMIIGVAITAIVTTNHAPALVQEAAPAADSGVFCVKSAYDMDETLVRIKKDIVAKGVRFFDEIDQAQLAASAGIKPALCRGLASRRSRTPSHHPGGWSLRPGSAKPERGTLALSGALEIRLQRHQVDRCGSSWLRKCRRPVGTDRTPTNTVSVSLSGPEPRGISRATGALSQYRCKGV